MKNLTNTCQHEGTEIYKNEKLVFTNNLSFEVYKIVTEI